MNKILNVPFTLQTNDSNCGPACLKMLLEYYNLPAKNSKLSHLAKSLNMTNLWGCQEQDFENYFTKNNIPFSHISYEQIEEVIQMGHPILTSFEDELMDGHYALITGVKSSRKLNEYQIFFNDPWPDFNRHFMRYKSEFMELADKYQAWLIFLNLPIPCKDY